MARAVIRQPSLFERPPDVAQPNALATEQGRTASNRDRVLARLLAGPATNVELVQIGGMRAMGRVHELRQAGYAITVERVSGGLFRVVLHG